ncbi:polysaccharide pyruvyl transferase family protein [Halobacillus litoralis]|uniref:polysaccharide pyruvyl transferase family protein n=1 Tax=Halobacillus litoralis TaxID=45668 RepID=UPI001CFC8577|nr:polysaccharide pyruvyl transferase family protein [Halobacillus litoralis]
MKIGIITYHHTTNFGATLQAYALSKFLNDEGFNAEIIDYRPKKAVVTYLRANYLNKQLLNNRKKVLKMNKFMEENISISKKRYSSNTHLSNVKYDLLITGSDEIWNIDSIRGFDKSYFLNFSNVPKLSYAASVGSLNSFGEKAHEISNLLKEFLVILARDKNTINLLEKECYTNSNLVLDPTFLISYPSAKKRIINSDYVLIYGELTQEEEEVIRESKNKFKIVSVGYFNKVADINFIDADPFDFLSLIKHAVKVYTNFYHGVLFSLNFSKQFKFLVRDNKTNKVYDILDRFNIMYEDTNIKSEKEIDYSKVNQLVLDGKRRSIELLKKNIEKVEQNEKDTFRNSL